MSTVAAPASVRVLLVKQEGAVRHAIKQVLESQGYTTEVSAVPKSAANDVRRERYDAVVFDLQDFGLDSFQSLVGELPPRVQSQIIALTDGDNVEAGIEATKAGAFGYLARPFDAGELVALVDRSLYKRDIIPRRVRKTDHEEATGPGGMVGDSMPMRRLYQLMERVASSRATVLVTGETGTGKELVARGIHDLSRRASRPFVPISCSAWPDSLLESELFGHMRGSFTGAFANRRGVFEEAHGGTLFLDEISSISANVQIKLLRVLQEREIRRVGAERSVPVDFRLVAATNVDLAKEVEAGRFREDLYYRLNVFPIQVPPLRERVADIPQLVSHFHRRFTRENELPGRPIDADTLARLKSYQWPGNVRELENFVERSVVMTAGSGHLAFEAPSTENTNGERALLSRALSAGWDLARVEREYIMDVLQSCDGRRAAAAEILGIDRRTLYRKLKEYGMSGIYADTAETEAAS